MVQARYGWTDDYVLGLPYARLRQVATMAAEAEQEEYRKLAFIGWQLGAGGKVTFGQHLRKLGLAHKPKPLSPEELQKQKQSALERAAKIVELDKKRKEAR